MGKLLYLPTGQYIEEVFLIIPDYYYCQMTVPGRCRALGMFERLSLQKNFRISIKFANDCSPKWKTLNKWSIDEFEYLTNNQLKEKKTK